MKKASVILSVILLFCPNSIVHNKEIKQNSVTYYEECIEPIKKQSNVILEYIKLHEGLRLKPYNSGGLTIGYGHLIKKGESFTIIDTATAERLLEEDFKKAENVIQTRLRSIKLKKNQQLALAHFVYALGEGNFLKSSLYKDLIANKPINKDHFTKWSFFKGKINKNIIKTRQFEYELFRY